MSRTTADPAGQYPSPQGLLESLVDDAAVFPPRSASLARAVAEYRDRRLGPLADFVGPLLVPASAAAELIALLQAGPDPPSALPVQLISRPGQDAQILARALAALRNPALTGRVAVLGVELAYTETWRAIAGTENVAVEVGRSRAGHHALADLAREAGTGRVRAKLRTQSTADDPVPTAGELAEFISTCRQLGLGFKLTGGLHHAVALTTRTATGTEDQHGVLNVLVAAHLADAGAGTDALTGALRERDGDALTAVLRRLDAGQVHQVRAAFTAFGCCDVNDPLADLADHGLLN